uniref:Uncharacterized protein n=1 Tax=Ditylenchus dipsaci TaxID=166011 RepID=A0A915DQ00_9BILA
MVGAFSLPVLAIERVCAAILVSDYEKMTRSYISIILIILLLTRAANPIYLVLHRASRSLRPYLCAL